MINYTLWSGSNFEGYRGNLLLTINGLDTTKTWDVEIKLHRKKKTDSQRGWWHKMLDLWSKEIGLTPGDCKAIVKGHYFGWKLVHVAGIEFPIPEGSSEDLDRIGYSALIETTYRLAAEGGIALPDADRSSRN